MIKLYVSSSTGTLDITELVQTITWSGDYQQCSRTLEFELLSSQTDKKVPEVKCELGFGVDLMQGNRVLFDGFIFERQKSSGNSAINITCYDRGIYLKRNEASYRFPGMTPETISRRICSDFSIETGSIASPNISVTRNFIGVSLYKIIQTAYTLASEATGKKYMLRFNGAKLDVIEKTITNETMVIEGGSNLMSASTTESIANMINQVVIYNENDKLVSTQKDAAAIKKYGLKHIK